MDQAAVLMGEYVGLGAQSGLERSFIGNTERLKLFARGTSYQVYQSKLKTVQENGTPIGVPVAVKMLAGSPSYADPTLYAHKQEFRLKQLQAVNREIRILSHPPLRTQENILHLLQYGYNTEGRDMDEDEEDKEWTKIQPFLVLEFAGHGTLKDFRQLPGSLNSIKDLALDIACGLSALHACGICHGDIKLENILVFSNPQRVFQAKISDLSHAIIDGQDAEYLGTKCYRPPEMLTLPGPLNHEQLLKCDVWAFGIAILELLLDTTLGDSQIANRTLLDSHLDRLQKSDIFVAMAVDVRSTWSAILRSSLAFEPQNRSSINSICEILGNSSRARLFITAPLNLSTLTPLEFTSRYPFMDEQSVYQDRLLQLSLYGEKDQQSLFYFQNFQCAAHGIGGKKKESQVVHSLLFSLNKTDGNSHPLPLSTIEHISQLGRITGSGPYVADIGQWEDDLIGYPTEMYYSQRIRRYRAGGLVRLVKSGLAHPLLRASVSTSELEPTLENLSKISTEDLVSVVEAPLDLPFLRRIPYFHLLCLLGDMARIGEAFAKRSENENLLERDEYGITPLLYACMGGHANVVRWLVDGGHTAQDHVDDNGCTPLHWLGMFPQDEISEMAGKLSALYPEWLERAATGVKLPIHFLWLRGPPLHWAVSCRDKESVSVLLDLGANIQSEHEGYSSLAKAVELHAYDLVELLLDRGARAILALPPRRSAMHFMAGNAPVIRRQLVHGCRLYKEAPMRTIKKLEAYGCDINSRDDFENTPLHKAIASPLERGDLCVMKAILKSGAARNAQNCLKDTPVHIAIKLYLYDYYNAEAIFGLLMNDDICFLDQEFNPALEDEDGRTPLLVAGLMKSGSLYVNGLPSTKQTFLGKDKYGNAFLDLAASPSEVVTQYAQNNIKRLREIELDVTLEPDCT